MDFHPHQDTWSKVRPRTERIKADGGKCFRIGFSDDYDGGSFKAGYSPKKRLLGGACTTQVPGTATPRIFSRRSHSLERDLLGLGSTGVQSRSEDRFSRIFGTD